MDLQTTVAYNRTGIGHSLIADISCAQSEISCRLLLSPPCGHFQMGVQLQTTVACSLTCCRGLLPARKSRLQTAVLCKLRLLPQPLLLRRLQLKSCVWSAAHCGGRESPTSHHSHIEKACRRCSVTVYCGWFKNDWRMKQFPDRPFADDSSWSPLLLFCARLKFSKSFLFVQPFFVFCFWWGGAVLSQVFIFFFFICLHTFLQCMIMNRFYMIHSKSCFAVVFFGGEGEGRVAVDF